ncbi:MAG: MOSC N-terminal beta barrel domain-containing protein [Myxococcota bacterium]|nr:MOSC N-terminal beta barrel domain-containing protein [Myxococcota bacterium]
MSEVEVQALYTYPIKSCAGVALERAALGQGGLLHDRSWMLVSTEGKFLNQQRHPKMALISITAIDASGVTVTAPDMRPLEIKRISAEDELGEPFRVYKSTVEGTRVGSYADDWFSEVLGTRCHLIQAVSYTSREVAEEHPASHDDPASIRRRIDFADDLPILVATRASLDALNNELEQGVEMERFRPNVILDGTAPFAEDGWRVLRREDGLELLGAKPCVRCSMITVDPSLGVLDGPEPLRTLTRLYNPDGNGPVFGALMMARGGESLEVGDRLQVTT